jgi:hypothetical protein
MSDPTTSQEDAFTVSAEPQKRRYFFDVFDGDISTTDADGLELDGLQSAQQEAVRALPDVARDARPR